MYMAPNLPVKAPAKQLPWTGVSVDKLIANWLSSKKPETMRAYRREFAQFSSWIGSAKSETAIEELIRRGQGGTNSTIVEYLAHLQESGKAPATVARKLAAIRSALSFVRLTGMIDWDVTVSGPAVEAYRDTQGPGTENYDRVLAYLSKQTDHRSVRNYALIVLMHDLALRRQEAARITSADLDDAAGGIWIQRKGWNAKRMKTVPKETRAALGRWLEVRGKRPGPVFGLTSDGIWWVFADIGRTLGFKFRPHGLRHLAATEALDRGASIREVMALTDHRDPRTLMDHYDDRRRDDSGKVATLISKRGGELWNATRSSS